MAYAKHLAIPLLCTIMIGCGDGREDSVSAHYPDITTNTSTLDISDAKQATIVDGDTIKLEFDGKLTTIRLIGIDTFESRNSIKAKAQAYDYGISLEEVIQRGKRAKTYIQAQLSNRVTHYLEYDEDFLDRYKRTLAYVWLSNKVMLNMKIICEGYALPLTISPNDKYAQEFVQCYEDAKAQGLGVWKK